MQVIDSLRLVRDDGPDNVADREHPHHFVAVQHGQVPDAVIGDDSHAIINRVLGGNRQHRAGHDLPNHRVF